MESVSQLGYVALFAVLLLRAVLPGEAFTFAINCGGKTSTTGPLYGNSTVYNPNNRFTSLAQGLAVTFLEDRYYYGTDMAVSYTPNITLVNGDPASAVLYETERSGRDLHYAIPVPNGNVTVELNFIETTINQTGARLFDININGEKGFERVDIFQYAGGLFKALPLQKGITVTKGYVLLDFIPTSGAPPKINAIRVFSTPNATRPFDNTTLPEPSPTVNINAGATAELATPNGTFAADTNFVGGRNSLINDTRVSGVYTTQRTGDKFSYVVNVPNGDYVVELHFADGVARRGLRVFHVLINGVIIIRALDVVAVAGGAYVPLVLKRSATVANGILRIGFEGLPVTYDYPVISEAFVNAIKIYPAAVNGAVVAIAAGSTVPVLSGEGIVFAADNYFTGGVASDNSTAPDGTPVAIRPLLSGQTSALYTRARVGPASYTIPIPNGKYVVDLRFAEPVFNASGQRIFNVTIQGALAVSLLDVFNKSHGILTALSIQRSAVVTTGSLSIATVRVVGEPILSAVLIRPDLVEPQARIYEAPYVWPVPEYPVSPQAPYPIQGIHVNFNPAPVLPGKFSYAVNTGCNDCPPYKSTFGPTFVADNVTCLNGGGGGGDVPPGEPYCHINILGPQGGFAVPLNQTINITGTNDPYIYYTERVGFNTFIFTVPNGIYEVNTFYAETSSADARVNVQGQDLRKFLQEPQGKQFPEGVGPIDPFRLANNQKFNATPPVTMYVWVGNNKLSVQLWPVGNRDAPAIKGIWAHEVPDVSPLNSTEVDNPAPGAPVTLALPSAPAGNSPGSAVALTPPTGGTSTSATTGGSTAAPGTASAVQGSNTTATAGTPASSAVRVCVALWALLVGAVAVLV